METHDPSILYAKVSQAAEGKLRYPEYVRLLIEAVLPDRADMLYKTAFRAKFLVRTRIILERLSPRDEAREKLKETFQAELELMKNDLLQMAALFPEQVRKRFDELFFSPTVESFGSLMDIFHDLSWIQNTKIDEANTRK